MKKINAKPARVAERGRAVIELTVQNRPGVMSHVCALFARRAFNLEGIAAMPVADGTRSRVWLSVEDDRRLEQMIKQLQKLRDVIDVRFRQSERGVFKKLEDYFRENPKERPQTVTPATNAKKSV